MVRIALLFPQKGFFEAAFETFAEHNQFQHDFETVTEEYVLEEVVTPGSQFDPEVIGTYDVVISRGITAELFRRQFQQPPLVEIPVAGNDLVRSMEQLRRQVGDKLIAIVGAHNMLYGAEELAEIVGMRVRCYERHSDSDWASAVDEALADGCEALLGGVETCAYAQRRGLPCALLRTGKEALWQAYTEAKKMVQVQMIEQRKSLRLRTIFDYTYEGILEIKADGTLMSFNHTACSTLGLSPSDEGKSAAACIPAGPFQELLLSTRTCENTLVPYGPLKLAVSKSRLGNKGCVWGYIITFQDVTRLQQMEKSIRKQLHAHGYEAKHTFTDILGGSPQLRRVIALAKQYAGTDLDVLITGPSGTGKELFAQSIHNQSARRNQPFVAINCAALHENLLESELFGYVEGAFTGAAKGGKTGLFEQAHGGTIFLDEVAEISTALQCKLLRVLQEREIMRLGDNRIIPIDIRVIAATNKNLFQYVKEGRFREDLYYRLDVLRVQLPSLNERSGDIPILAQHFIDAYAAHYQPGAGAMQLTEDACALLEQVHWHGNIRQLKNICLRTVVTCRQRHIGAHALAEVLDDAGVGTVPDSSTSLPEPSGGAATTLPATESEAQRIRHALERCGYRREAAAALLGISRSTLWKKMKALQINEK